VEPLINVDTTEAPQPTINIDTGVAPPQPPSAEVAQTRAYKTHMGLGDVLKQDYNQILQGIVQGQENTLRENAALQITADAAEKRQQDLVKLAAAKGRALTLEDVQKYDAPPADPKSVVEQGYARAYVNTAHDATERMDGDTVLNDAAAQNPEAVKAYMDRGSDVLFKREYAMTASQNLQPVIDQSNFWNFKEPFFGTDVKIAKINTYDLKQLASLGFYESAMLRGNVPGVSRLGFLGNVMDEQAKEILKLPAPEFQKEFDKIKDNLSASEPQLAQQWAQSVAGMSTSQKFVYNATEVANLAQAGAALKGFKIASGIARDNQLKIGGDLSPGADGVYRPTGPTEPPAGGGGALVPVQQQAAKAVDDIVKSANVPQITKASIAEGAGDVKEAGVQKALNSVTEPNPTKDAVDTLFSYLRSDLEENKANPGNLSREEHTRLLDAAAGFEKNTIDLVVNSSKVMRTPAMAEDGFRQVADRVKTLFHGRESTIMDIQARPGPLGDVVLFDVHIGNYGAVPFSSYELASNHASINGYPIEGIQGQAGSKIYFPASAILQKDYSDPDKVTYKPRAFEIKHFDDNDVILNTDGVEVQQHANPEPGLVPYDLKTRKFGEPLTEETARIEQQGLGFRIVITKPFDETQTFVRDNLIGARTTSLSNASVSPISQASNVLFGVGGYVRNPYDTLSKAENENRAKTVFGQTKFLNVIKQEIAPVEAIYKGMLGDGNVLIEKPLSYVGTVTGANRMVAEQFTRALVASQTMPDPKTALPGYYMKTPAEIQFFWESNFKRPATFKEQQAYLAIGRLDHFDHILRQASEYKYKSRVGVETWSFTTVKDGQQTVSPEFDAKQLKKVPPATDDVMLIHGVDGSETYFHKMGTTRQNDFRSDVLKGKFTGVEIYNPELRPIVRYDEDGNVLRIRYVFSNNMKSKPLTYDQIGYRGGGHWEYDYEHAVKQAIIRPQKIGNRFQHIYEGDATFGFVSNRAMGEDFAKHMNEIARLIRKRDTKGAKAYAKSVFDIEWKDLYSGFRPSKNPKTGEIQPARFSTDPRQEFRVVSMGKTIFQLDKNLEEKYTKTDPKTDAVSSTFVDGTRHGSLARNFQVAFSQARESYKLHEPFNVGTNERPFYQFRPAKLTDPISTMTRALNRIVNSTYMDDMKITAVEHWLEENKGLLDASIQQIRANPFYYFNEGKFKADADTNRKLLAQSNRYKIKEFVGQPSTIDVAIQGVKQTLSDALYELGRDRAVDKLDKAIEGSTSTSKRVALRTVKAPLVAPEWMLDRLSNPVDFVRGMAFHLNLGMFSLKQVVVQSMAFTTIFGLAGFDAATAGSFGSWMHIWSLVNGKPEVLAHLDRLATNFGWKPGELTEARRILLRTGFGAIGNEVSLDNGLHKQSFFRNDIKTLGSIGQIPFNAGNLNVRFGAWYTAFREFRRANPTMKIGPIEEGKILYRANYLNTLMTRDANTVLNKGLIGVPMQFYDYMKKIMDVFWGKNLADNFQTRLVKDKDGVYRPSENSRLRDRMYVRARMMVLYAMLGGAAGSTGVTGLPLGDIIRNHAIQGTLPGQGGEPYVPGASLPSTLIMEGTVSTLLSYAIGHGDLQKGTFYNFNSRFNPNGLQVIKDLMSEDPKFWKIVLGASGTTVGKEIASLRPFTNAIYSMIEGNPAKEAWPLMADDWIAPLSVANSWSDYRRLQYALAYGKWLDSHGRPTSDVSKVDAFFRTITGLTDQRIEDKRIKDTSLKERTALYDEGGNEYLEQRRLAEQAVMNNDNKQANDYNKRAFFALTSRNIPIEAWGKYLARDASMNRDTLTTTDERYFLQFVPTDKQEAYREAFRKSIKKDQ